eukprot:scaffold144205_cov17-Tisochrysis_lutea.AAC.1
MDALCLDNWNMRGWPSFYSKDEGLWTSMMMRMTCMGVRSAAQEAWLTVPGSCPALHRCLFLFIIPMPLLVSGLLLKEYRSQFQGAPLSSTFAFLRQLAASSLPNNPL